MKVAIVAKGGTSSLAPWHDPEWEIWGLPWISYPRVDRLFDTHEQAVWDESTEEIKKNTAERGVELAGDKPVWTFESRAWAYKNPVVYPLVEVMAFLPRDYLENSIAYMIALALYEGAEEIGLWGVHLMGVGQRGEYAVERPCVLYLIGLADGMKVPVTIPPGCPLFMSGFEAGRYGVNLKRREGIFAIPFPPTSSEIKER